MAPLTEEGLKPLSSKTSILGLRLMTEIRKAAAPLHTRRSFNPKIPKNNNGKAIVYQKIQTDSFLLQALSVVLELSIIRYSTLRYAVTS